MKPGMPESTDNPYQDILQLERPWPEEIRWKYPRMPQLDRAAQFAPFEALLGRQEVAAWEKEQAGGK